MTRRGLLDTLLAQAEPSATGRVVRRSAARPAAKGWDRWVSEPRNAVWLVLGAVCLVGGGRRLLQVWRARGAVAKLEGNSVAPDDIAAVVVHGRAGLMDLFRLLGAADTETQRQAAGHALSVLWARDELIAEEEKGLVLRGFHLDVKARKRYPRALRAEIPVTLHYGVPFLQAEGGGVAPARLEWSHRVVGARRASLESFSPWTPGPIHTTFSMIPSDFETDGPHSLVTQVRVRTAGLTDAWELALPHARFSFEFDPILRVEALLALPDLERAEVFGRQVRLVASRDAEAVPGFLPISASLALRDPPEIELELPLPNDLAHAVEVELEGVAGRFPAGAVLQTSRGVPGQGAGPIHRPIGPIEGLPAGAVERPGRRRLRAILTADPHRGWAEPDVRSLWPGTIETGWVEVEVVRR